MCLEWIQQPLHIKKKLNVKLSSFFDLLQTNSDIFFKFWTFEIGIQVTYCYKQPGENSSPSNLLPLGWRQDLPDSWTLKLPKGGQQSKALTRATDCRKNIGSKIFGTGKNEDIWNFRLLLKKIWTFGYLRGKIRKFWVLIAEFALI